MNIVNIAGYRFVELSDLESLRSELLDLTHALELRGSILLSQEGINLFIAGRREDIDRFLRRVRAVPGLSNFAVKESLSVSRPFNRMIVKVKREIIAFGVEGIEPARHTSPHLTPQELKRWLDEGRAFTLLDTRNNFEIEVGTFDNAKAIGVDDFRDFPLAVAALPEELKSRPIVTFCTGGIRCEKAAPFLETQGFREVYQLDGGILKYFEECGDAHFRGHCFVFDQRVALDAKLQPADWRQCFKCRAVLSVADCESEDYVAGEKCPRCALRQAD